ncbi:MAG: transglutaminase-like domain-containing protein [Pseudomonadota bacterium]
MAGNAESLNPVRRVRRWLTLVLALAIAAVAAWWWQTPQGFDPADYLRPEQRYRLSWHGQIVGHQREVLRQLPSGEWLLELELNVAATVRDTPLQYREHEQLTFAAEPPHRLLRGDWRREQNQQSRRVQFENGQQLQVRRWLDSTPTTSEQPALAYSLADYYAVNSLVRRAPAVGERIAFTRLNSEHLQLLHDEVAVLSQGSAWRGQPWRLSWKRADERWQAEWWLDDSGHSLSMNIGEAIRLERDGDDSAVSSVDLYFGQTIHTDRALGAARDVVVLELRWPQSVPLPLSETPGQTVLPGFVRTDSREHGMLAPLLEWQAALAPEPRYSSADSRLQKLAKQLVAGAADSRDKTSRLLHFVSQHLQQQDVLIEQSAADILRTRRGDCTEFSQLFVALARAAGLPAREVSGLVYLGDEVQGFGGHSWAEVVVDGRWLAVDPMWNLLPVSATHLRMGSGDDGALAAALARRDLQFSVAQVSYR